MVEVAIVSVEAVFDWKQYLKDTFGMEEDDRWHEDDSYKRPAAVVEEEQYEEYEDI